jgi:hypothetical protein
MYTYPHFFIQFHDAKSSLKVYEIGAFLENTTYIDTNANAFPNTLIEGMTVDGTF